MIRSLFLVVMLFSGSVFSQAQFVQFRYFTDYPGSTDFLPYFRDDITCSGYSDFLPLSTNSNPDGYEKGSCVSTNYKEDEYSDNGGYYTSFYCLEADAIAEFGKKCDGSVVSATDPEPELVDAGVTYVYDSTSSTVIGDYFYLASIQCDGELSDQSSSSNVSSYATGPCVSTRYVKTDRSDSVKSWVEYAYYCSEDEARIQFSKNCDGSIYVEGGSNTDSSVFDPYSQTSGNENIFEDEGCADYYSSTFSTDVTGDFYTQTCTNAQDRAVGLVETGRTEVGFMEYCDPSTAASNGEYKYRSRICFRNGTERQCEVIYSKFRERPNLCDAEDTTRCQRYAGDVLTAQNIFGIDVGTAQNFYYPAGTSNLCRFEVISSTSAVGDFDEPDCSDISWQLIRDTFSNEYRGTYSPTSCSFTIEDTDPPVVVDPDLPTEAGDIDFSPVTARQDQQIEQFANLTLIGQGSVERLENIQNETLETNSLLEKIEGYLKPDDSGNGDGECDPSDKLYLECLGEGKIFNTGSSSYESLKDDTEARLVLTKQKLKDSWDRIVSESGSVFGVSFVGGGTIEPFIINVKGVDVDLGWSKWTDQLGGIGNILIMVSMFIGLMIVLGGNKS